MTHRRMGTLIWVLASAPFTFIAAIVAYAYIAATLHKQLGSR